MVWNNLAWLLLGWSLLLLGILIVPFPLPLGLLTFSAGLAILIPRNATLRRLLSWARGNYPRTVSPVVHTLERMGRLRWLGGRRHQPHAEDPHE